MNRAQHLAWCKQRAMEYVQQGDLRQAFASMTSDLNKHDELREQHRSTNQLGFQLLMGGHLETVKQMTDWIQGYN